MQGK
ncbi:hypothetical protein D043_0458A, partial [Vibrio parahaemolyticus EKP-021]